MTKISVVLAVYNEQTYLKSCLDSLAKQQKVDYEVIVVDDGSTKPVVASDYQVEKSNLFSFYRIDHSGTAISRNFGVSKAKGTIVVFVDGDMEFEPSFLSDLTEPIVQGESQGTFSTEEYVANWDNIYARCWNYENGLFTQKRIKTERGDMIRDFRAILKSEFTRVKGFDNVGYTDTWSLSQKLGYSPVATKAKYYHYNPSTLEEIFNQAIWIWRTS